MECSICLGNIESKRDLITTSCNHNYHIDCLYKWYKNEKTCPYCRDNIDKSQKIKEFFFKSLINQCLNYINNVESYKSLESLKPKTRSLKNCSYLNFLYDDYSNYEHSIMHVYSIGINGILAVYENHKCEFIDTGIFLKFNQINNIILQNKYKNNLFRNQVGMKLTYI